MPQIHIDLRRDLPKVREQQTLAADDSYAALKAYGHSPAKAAEIVLDASRGDQSCQRWIDLVRKFVTQAVVK